MHKLRVSSPSGTGRGTNVELDGKPIHPMSVTIQVDAQSLVQATIVFDAVQLEQDGECLVEVTGIKDPIVTVDEAEAKHKAWWHW